MGKKMRDLIEIFVKLILVLILILVVVGIITHDDFYISIAILFCIVLDIKIRIDI